MGVAIALTMGKNGEQVRVVCEARERISLAGVAGCASAQGLQGSGPGPQAAGQCPLSPGLAGVGRMELNGATLAIPWAVPSPV